MGITTVSDTVLRMDDPLLNRWVTSMRAAGLSERTIERKQVVARVAMESKTLTHTMTTESIEGWLSCHNLLEQSSRATYVAALRAWSVWLVLQGIRDDDPTIRLGRIKVPPGEPRPVTTEQLQAVFDSRIRPKTRTMLILAAYQGFRVSEIANIRGEDVDLIGGQLRVKGKGGKKVWLPLHSRTAAEAARYSRRGYWFPSQSTAFRPMHRSSVSDVMSRAIHRADVDASAHQLRHWFATQLLRNGADMRTVQKLMRHASLSTTAIYTLVDPDRLASAMEALPEVA